MSSVALVLVLMGLFLRCLTAVSLQWHQPRLAVMR
jgi:hypothetical protein